MRGINSIQAVFDGTRWKVTQIVWQPETPTETYPGTISAMIHQRPKHWFRIEDISAAAARIAGIAVKTPLVSGLRLKLSAARYGSRPKACSPLAASNCAARPTRSCSSTPDEIRRGVITYSSGNHAQGVAYAARAVGAKAVIVMPSNAPAIKRAATLALGAEIVDVGVASSDRLAKAEELVREHGYVVIPPYDDEQIIAGQATAASKSSKPCRMWIWCFRRSRAAAC